MNQEVKVLWVKALESGEYKVTTGAMAAPTGLGRDGYSHCCLGALSVLYADEHGVEYEYNGEYIMFPTVLDRWGDVQQSEGTYLAKCVGEWADLDGEVQLMLANENDKHMKYPIEMIKAL